MQDSLTKQWETSPSVALPLDKLELVHKTLGHPIGVALAQASKDGLLVAFESCCKSLQFEEPAFGVGRDAFHRVPNSIGNMGTRWTASLPGSGILCAK